MNEPSSAKDIAQSIQTTFSLLRRRIAQTDGEGGLSMPQLAALARLDQHGPSTVSDLARAEGISTQSMGATLGPLAEAGLIDRRPDATDGRRVFLRVTPVGAAALHRGTEDLSRKIADTLLREFSEPELSQLSRAAGLLERLAHSLGQARPSAAIRADR
jgi:DNA-binding MarR family transcriptional regulator